MTPEAFNAATAPKLQTIGALHYFHPHAKAAAEELGIDSFRFYFVGRAGVLGNVPAPVAQSSFGYFDEGLLAKMWNTGKERADFAATAQAQLAVSYKIGAEQLGGVDGLAEAAASMAEMAAAVDMAGLPLFAGFASMDMPKDPTAAFMHQAIVQRELRGGVHLACCTALGLPTRVAHQIKRPNDQQGFGYPDELELTDPMRDTYAQVEPMTDAAMAIHADAISADQRSQVATTVDAAATALGLDDL